jgi:ATP-dependent RNA helicase RhlE
LPHVVNYELPNVPEDYVHRIGRTGRAGKRGEAVSLVCVDEHHLLRDIERVLKRKIPRVVLEGYEPDPGLRSEPLQETRKGTMRSRSGVSGKRSEHSRSETGSQRPDQERNQASAKHRSVWRKRDDPQSNSQHRHPRPGRNQGRVASSGGGRRNG